MPSRLLSVILRDRILPYTYRPQPAALRDDLLSYHRTVATVKAVYRDRFPTEPSTPAWQTPPAWLSNDICRFLNNDQPTMLGYVEFYKRVFQRQYLNRSRSLSAVCLSPGSSSPMETLMIRVINVSIGLLLPGERWLLEVFLGAC